MSEASSAVRVLVIRDLFAGGNPTRPLDPARLEAERQHLARATGWDVRTMHYDKVVQDDPMFCHAQFLDTVEALRPAFVWYRPQIVPQLIHRNLRPEVLYAARALFAARLAIGFGELRSASVVLYSAAYASIADVAVATEGDGAPLRAYAPSAKVVDLWPSVDGSLFTDLGLARDVDVCVVGAIDQHSALRESLGGLGLSVAAADDAGDHAATDRRVELLNRARLALILPRAAGARLKPGLIEAIRCGAMPLDGEDTSTRRHLTPFRHYVPFGDGADLAAKVRRYLGNEPGRRTLVAAAKAHVAAQLSERIWWQRVMEAATGA